MPLIFEKSLPRVTVLMAAFNAESHLAAAVESVLSQRCYDFEFIIIDDGSTDRTPEILSRYMNDPRVRLISLQTNQGLINALNLGLQHARGLYLARMDADDVCLPQRLERQVAWLDQHPEVGVLGTAAVRIDSRGRTIERMVSVSNPDAVATRLASGICPIIHSSVLARTDLLRSLGGYRIDFPHAEDYDLWLRVLHESKIAVLPDPLLYYRSSVDGIRFTRVSEATVSRAYALDCYQRRCNGQPELARAQFLAGYDPSQRTVETLWSMTLEALMLERRDIASTLTDEILRREPSHRSARLLMSLLGSPIAGGTALAYQGYRRARGWLGSTPIGPMLSNLKHRSAQQALEV